MVNKPSTSGSTACVVASMLTYETSLSVITPNPLLSVKVISLPPKLPSLKSTVNVSVGSTTKSPLTVTLMVCDSPDVPLNVKVPVSAM